MKNKIFKNIISLFIVVLCMLIFPIEMLSVEANNSYNLETPTNLRWTDERGSARWNGGKKDSNFDIRMYRDNKPFYRISYSDMSGTHGSSDCTGTFDINLSQWIFESGSYTFTVQAFEYINGEIVESDVSAMSGSFNYVHPGVSLNGPGNLSLNGSILSWVSNNEYFENLSCYSINIDGVRGIMGFYKNCVDMNDMLTEDMNGIYYVTVHATSLDITRIGHSKKSERLPFMVENGSIVNDSVVPEPSIHIDKTDLILTKGKTATLTAVTNPEGIPVKWSSSDNNVAIVKYKDNTCEITAVAEGNATITAEITVDGKKMKDTCALSVIKSSQEDIAEAYANYVSTFFGCDREQALKKLPEGAKLPNKWCSAFIGQTAEAFGLSKIIPLRPGVGELYRDILSLKGNSAKGFYFVEKDKYNVENSTYTNRDNFIPKVGDLVIFKWNDAGSNITFSHVGIVTKVENPERITVIHGNTDKSDVGKWYPLNFRKNNSEVVAFVRPNYGVISNEWTGKIKHSFECPVDVCVIFDGEELNSVTDSTITGFGTMTMEEDCITVILDYGNPYNIVVTGKDEGTMKLTTEFDTNHGQNTRSFIDIPITKDTTIHVYADAATAGIELLVDSNDAEITENLWYAEPGDTVDKVDEALTNAFLDESWTGNIIITIEEDRTAIDTDGGTLQLIADIFPEREIEWTVEPITGEAVIDQNGLLTAIKNGTVTVTAATKDGSDIKESIDIIISNQTEWKTWESKYDIALDKTWTVEFNKILDAATVKGNNIYVTDQNNQVVSTSLYQQNNKKVRVIPTKNYQSGHTYILWIKGLKAEDGSLLGENVKMEFTIK